MSKCNCDHGPYGDWDCPHTRAADRRQLWAILLAIAIVVGWVLRMREVL